MEIINEIIKNEKEYIDNYSLNDDYELSRVSNIKTTEIVRDLLLEIDPFGVWLDLFINARKTAHIIYINDLDDERLIKYEKILGITGLKNLDNTCINIDNTESFVFLNYEGNIRDIVFTMHEIIHYITARMDDVTKLSPVIREFPSIFYELYTLNYLKQLGYSENELKSIYNKRIYETYNSLNMTEKLGIDNTSYTPYVVGEYLARNALIKTKEDEQLLPMIKYMTENLSKTNLEDIYYLINYNNKKKKLSR